MKYSKGFTLIEMMIVIAIIGILAAIAIPQFKAYKEKGQHGQINPPPKQRPSVSDQDRKLAEAMARSAVVKKKMAAEKAAAILAASVQVAEGIVDEFNASVDQDKSIIVHKKAETFKKDGVNW